MMENALEEDLERVRSTVSQHTDQEEGEPIELEVSLDEGVYHITVNSAAPLHETVQAALRASGADVSGPLLILHGEEPLLDEGDEAMLDVTSYSMTCGGALTIFSVVVMLGLAIVYPPGEEDKAGVIGLFAHNGVSVRLNHKGFNLRPRHTNECDSLWLDEFFLDLVALSLFDPGVTVHIGRSDKGLASMPMP